MRQQSRRYRYLNQTGPLASSLFEGGQFQVAHSAISLEHRSLALKNQAELRSTPSARLNRTNPLAMPTRAWGPHRHDECRHTELEQPGALHRLDIVLTALEARLGLRLAPRDPCLRGQLRDQRLPALRGVGAAAR